MSELIHTSNIKILQDKPPERRALIENFAEPVYFGVHGGIKHFYKMEPARDSAPLPSTTMIAAVAG